MASTLCDQCERRPGNLGNGQCLRRGRIPEGGESLGNVALGNGKMWICGPECRIFCAFPTAVWRASGGGMFGGETAMMDKWVFHGGRRPERDTGYAGQAVERHRILRDPSDEAETERTAFGRPSTSLAGIGMPNSPAMPPARRGGQSAAIAQPWFAGMALREEASAQDAFNKAVRKTQPQTHGLAGTEEHGRRNLWCRLRLLWPRINWWSVCSAGRAHVQWPRSPPTGAKVWTANLPEQPAMMSGRWIVTAGCWSRCVTGP